MAFEKSQKYFEFLVVLENRFYEYPKWKGITFDTLTALF